MGRTWTATDPNAYIPGADPKGAIVDPSARLDKVRRYLEDAGADVCRLGRRGPADSGAAEGESLAT